MTDRIIRSLLKLQFSQSSNQLDNTNLFSCNNHHSSHIQTIPEIINKFINLMLRPTTNLISKMRSGNGSITLRMFVYRVPHLTRKLHKMMKKAMEMILTLVAQSMNTMMNKTWLMLNFNKCRCTQLPKDMSLMYLYPQKLNSQRKKDLSYSLNLSHINPTNHHLMARPRHNIQLTFMVRHLYLNHSISGILSILNKFMDILTTNTMSSILFMACLFLNQCQLVIWGTIEPYPLQ